MYVPALAVTTETDSYRLSPWLWPLTRRVQSAMATRTHVRTGTSCDHSDRLKPPPWLIKSEKGSVGSDRAKVHTGTDHRDRLTIPVTLTKYEKSSVGRDMTDYWPAPTMTMHRERNRPSTWLTREKSLVGSGRYENRRTDQHQLWPSPVTREKSLVGSGRYENRRTDQHWLWLSPVTLEKSSVCSGS